MSNSEQSACPASGYTTFMSDAPIRILAVDVEAGGLFVTFSDGTSAGFVIEELLDLRPYREPLS